MWKEIVLHQSCRSEIHLPVSRDIPHEIREDFHNWENFFHGYLHTISIGIILNSSRKIAVIEIRNPYYKNENRKIFFTVINIKTI